MPLASQGAELPDDVLDEPQPVRGLATSEIEAHDAHCLHLDADARRDASLRLKSAKGHLEGVLRMLEDPDVYCVDVLKQVKAVQGALAKVGERVLRSHIRDHVTTAAQRGDTEAIVDELMEALKYRARP